MSWRGSLFISLSGDISCHLWQHWHRWLFLCVGAEKHQGRKKIIIFHYSGTQRKVDSCCRSMKYPLSGQAPAWAGRRPPLHRNPSPRLQCGRDAAFGHRDQLPLPSCLGPRTDSAARRPGPLWLVTWPEPQGGWQSCAKSLCPRGRAGTVCLWVGSLRSALPWNPGSCCPALPLCLLGALVVPVPGGGSVQNLLSRTVTERELGLRFSRFTGRRMVRAYLRDES